jgi:mono/diheme cytochrome c family protein
MKVFLTIVITLAVLIILGLVYIYSGFYDVAASNPPGKLETWFFSTVMDNSVEHHSKGIESPPLNDTSMIDEGFGHFNRMCVGCHGAPGINHGRRSRAFNPPPPDLAEAVSDQSDAEIFWIVKNGIKMTGMPAFGESHNDQEIWQIISFVHLLPKMTAEQYQGYKDRLGQQEHRD